MPRRRLTPIALALLALVLVMGACAAPEPFDPTGPCSADGAAPGAYPELEALIPTTFEGQAPETLDSGRHCTPENLGSLAEMGIDEVRFAGGTWGFGGRRAAALVVFTAPGLTAEDIAVFYNNSAAVAPRTTVMATSDPTLAGRPGFRIDTETGERIQTVLVWPSAVPDRVHVVISTDLPDPKLLAAVDAIEAASAP
jgi:hypothetical protein